MKYALLLLLLTICCHAYGQSLSHEYSLLNEKFKSGDLSVEKVRDMKAELKDIEKNGTYPVLEYDSASSDITYKYVLDCPGISKSILYKRIKEWCALKYGDFETVLRYEDFETGKIIVKGYVNLPYDYGWLEWFGQGLTNTQKTKCTHALVATVKDFKIKFEIRELAYDFEYGGYMIGTTYYAKTGYKLSISSFLPLVNNARIKDWKTALSLLKNTESEFRLTKESLHRYLMDYLVDYKF
jgi:hypothetical protein